MSWSITYGLYVLSGIPEQNIQDLKQYEHSFEQLTDKEKRLTDFLDIIDKAISDDYDVNLLDYFSLIKLKLRINTTLKSLQEGKHFTEVLKPYALSSTNVLQHPQQFLAVENEINKTLIPMMREWVKTHMGEPYLNTIRTFLKSCLRVGQKPVYDYEFHPEFPQLLTDVIKSKNCFGTIDLAQLLKELVAVVPPAQWASIMSVLFKDPVVFAQMKQYKGLEQFLTTVLKPAELQMLLKNNSSLSDCVKQLVPVEQNNEIDQLTQTLRELTEQIEKAKQTLQQLNGQIEEKQYHLDNMADSVIDNKKGCLPFFKLN